MNKEIRSLQTDFSYNADNSEMRIEGYAIKFDSPTILYTDEYGVEYREVIKPEAFTNTDLSDVLLLYNHEDATPLLARGSNNTLRLTVDNIGLKLEATIAPTTLGKDVYTLIQRGDLSGLSIGFVVGDEHYISNTRYITDIKKLYEISIVNTPAYKDAFVQALKRGCLQAEEAEIRQKQKLITTLLTY